MIAMKMRSYFRRRLPMADMMERLRLRPEDLAHDGDKSVLEIAEATCENCESKGACKKWLRSVVFASEAPYFCENKVLFRGRSS